MTHSILHIYDKNGKQINFERFKQKRPETVFRILADYCKQGYENLFFKDTVSGEFADTLVINYTGYESTSENETARISMEEFKQKYLN